LPNFLAGTTGAEGFVVLKAAIETPAANRPLWALAGNSLNQGYPNTSGTIEDDFGSTIDNTVSSPTQPLNQYNVYEVTGQSNFWGAWLNGTLQSSSANNTYTSNGSPTLGAVVNGDGSTYFAGDVAEVLVFNRELQVPERSTVETYLIQKYFTTNLPPYITNSPLSQGVLPGGSVTLTVGAGGTGPLAYQWQSNGVAIPGATQMNFTLTNYQSIYSGNYSVVITNSFGSILSPNAALSLAVPPWIIAEPTNQEILQGGTATFTVSANGPGPISYQWQFNGVVIPGATASTYVLTNAQTTNAGNYDVAVTNIAGSVVSLNVLLTVEIAPSITTQPMSQTNNAGATAVFDIVAAGAPPPSYQWKFDGTNISNATGSVLCITNLQSTNAGTYSVSVSNIAGTLASSNAVLTVIPMDTNGLPENWELEYFGVLGVNPLADPDYDGRNNFQEYNDGTDPVDPNSVLYVKLGYWCFNNTNWIGQEGQVPLIATNLQITPTFATNGVVVNSVSNAVLTYRDVESNGLANINCRNGSVVFWIQPAWNGGTGPGNPGRLIEMGDTNSTDGWWSLWVDAYGSNMTFQSKSNGVLTTYFTQSISSWSSNSFYQIALTYSPAQTALYINGILEQTNGGITNYPDLAVRSTNGFSLGSDYTGQYQARATFDELQTFNGPLSSAAVNASYLGFSAPGDNGLYNYINWLEGWNPFAPGIVPDTNSIVNLQLYTPLQ
jgi:hypothetical protein